MKTDLDLFADEVIEDMRNSCVFSHNGCLFNQIYFSRVAANILKEKLQERVVLLRQRELLPKLDLASETPNYLWGNDRDTWYNFSDWVIAASPAECNEIIAKREEVTLSKVLERHYTWHQKEKASGHPRYLCFSKSSPNLTNYPS